MQDLLVVRLRFISHIFFSSFDFCRQNEITEQTGLFRFSRPPSPRIGEQHMNFTLGGNTEINKKMREVVNKNRFTRTSEAVLINTCLVDNGLRRAKHLI